MTETKEQYHAGGLALGNAGESFNIRLDYLELLPSGKTVEQTFTCETLAKDAARALQFALKHFNETQPEISPGGRIWQLTAHVEVASDVLRDKLRETI